MSDGILLDADFRRTPKTKVFCHRCQKDVPDSSPRVWIADDMQTVLPPGHSLASVVVHLGTDCLRSAGIPSDWIISND